MWILTSLKSPGSRHDAEVDGLPGGWSAAGEPRGRGDR